MADGIKTKAQCIRNFLLHKAKRRTIYSNNKQYFKVFHSYKFRWGFCYRTEEFSRFFYFLFLGKNTSKTIHSKTIYQCEMQHDLTFPSKIL